jgi:hypothetical protein
VSPENRGNQRNVISRWWEGHQNCAALAKGLPYSSSNNGHGQDLEKYAHGGDSHAEGCHENCLERSSQVVKELKERDTHVKKEGREVVKRSLESGQLDDSIVVEIFDKRARSSNDGPFKIVRTNWSACMYLMCQTYQ